jgi:hypothetical protein
MCLIYESESIYEKWSEAERKNNFDEYMTFTRQIVQSGHLKAGDALQPVATATTVRVRNGKTLKTDGPFAETKEQLGGYYLIEAKDLDEAIGIAARIPGAKTGSIEVRPVMVIPGDPGKR